MTLTARTKAVLLGAIVGALGLLAGLTPPGLAVEETLGLDALFRLRGPQPAPAEAVVVTIDRESARALDLPNLPRKWPRALHGALVDRLVEAGAAVIVFDIIFTEPREPDGDRVLAEAVRRAGNVVLFEYLYKETLPLTADEQGQAMVLERRVPPYARLAGAAAARAPFPLPKVPVKVSQFWAFMPSTGGDATLPAMALQLYLLPEYDRLHAALAALDPARAAGLPPTAAALRAGRRGHEAMRALRVMLREDPALARRLSVALRDPARAEPRLAALLDLYRGPDSYFLNFYGPPRSITTVPYHRVLRGAESVPDLRGKAVFVGFSERAQPEQQDGFYTVYSQPTGLDVSGVEIGATAFANLLENRPVRAAPHWVFAAFLLLWGMVLGAYNRLASARWAILGSLALGAGYFGIVYLKFAGATLWLPWVVPLLVQLPAALFLALLWRYADTNRERRNIRAAFGYFLPNKVVDQLAGNLGYLQPGRLLYGAVLATDADSYTSLGERLPPEELAALMNRYYAALFPAVRAHGGVVSDVVGDAMLALWAGGDGDRALRARACHAALDVAAAVERFNAAEGGLALPTRIGLHAGELVLGSIGAADHFEYRAVGDIVNTANRIQDLNKRLGTRILVSEAAAAWLDEFVFRELGRFRLRGKRQPLALYELIGRRGEVDPARLALGGAFVGALAAFQAGRFAEAGAAFDALCARYPEDGPARLYRDCCRRFCDAPPAADGDQLCIELG
ncbi:MAG TPA: adenylate/guanylate cyclase domain-containing protein [Acidiferrobacterales bacterium]